MQNVQHSDHCGPDEPIQTQNEPCQGEIHGTVSIECCCPKIHTRTFIVNIGPQSEAGLIAYLQNTVNAYEQNGYLVLGHSLVDAGAGWILGLSVGWYQ